MPSPALLGLAFLKANWDNKKKDYIDTFVPLVIECLRDYDYETVHLEPLQKIMLDKFRLKIPQSCIHKIVIRLKKTHYIYQKDKVLYVQKDRIQSYTDFSKIQQECLNKHHRLIKRFVNHCSIVHSINWSEQDAEAALLRYLNEYRLVGLNEKRYCRHYYMVHI